MMKRMALRVLLLLALVLGAHECPIMASVQPAEMPGQHTTSSSDHHGDGQFCELPQAPAPDAKPSILPDILPVVPERAAIVTTWDARRLAAVPAPPTHDPRVRRAMLQVYLN